MYELRFHGQTSILDLDGETVSAVLRQPRRLALLAMLILDEGAGRTRGELATLFWPSHAEGAARRNLNQALYFLRRHMPDLLQTEGERVSARPSAFRCDVHSIDALLAKGDLQGAISQYHGQLLDGLAATDAPLFEEWLDRERAHRHRRICNAAWALSGAAERDGEPAVATFWGERAVQLEGWREPGVRRLMGLLQRAGDLHAALHTYERLRNHLQVTFGEVPSHVTMALSKAVKDELDRGSIEPSDFADLTRYMDKYVTHCRRSEWEAATDMLTDDAVYLPPGEPIVEGRQAVLAWLRARPPLIDYQWTILSARRVGDHAWSHGMAAITAEIGGHPVTMSAKVSNTLVRMPDGSWKATSVTWNTDGPGPIV